MEEEVEEEEVRCLDLTSYQLHDLGEVEIPESIEELDLTANRLSKLDPRVALLSHLKKLSLRQNLYNDEGIKPLSRWDTISGLHLLVDFESFHCLPLSPVLDRSENIIDGCTLMDCLKHFTAVEHLESYHCSRCWHIAVIKHLSLKSEKDEVILMILRLLSSTYRGSKFDHK
ncbi:ubiquitin carboxyl-terminal hydrolase 27-like isoform X3 [Ananas comosus]|uniref:Ubiquitin carboxyl-terminal hydrolase 27-like isoform X3 n=1 Tax=Ananas comosus TaxID=4615 RepID=A0A6P5FH90_ANACO|nr:ubiquitin carboxyl-terminal hydrolase 27-like isoform X3 [Ananas comosus]